MADDVLKNLTTVRIGADGKTAEVDSAVANSVETMIREAPGTPLEKAVAQTIYMLNFLQHAEQISEGGFELMVAGISNICKSLGDDMTPEKMNQMVEVFENANMMAHQGVQRQ